MDTIRAIRLLALAAVLNQHRRNPKPDPEYFRRFVMRWYSKRFHTPLDKVEGLPMEDILQAYFEERYEELQEPELEREKAEILKTEEDLVQEDRKRDLEQAQMFDDMLWAKRDNERMAKLRLAKAQKRQGLQTTAPGTGINAGLSSSSPFPMSSLQKTPANISLSFVSESELDLDRDSLGLLDTPKPR